MSTPVTNDEVLMQQMGEQLEKFRIAQKMSENVLVEKSGVSRSTLSKFKAGENITVLNLIKLCRALGVIDSLLQIFPEELNEGVDFTRNKKPKARKRFSDEESKLKPQSIAWKEKE